MEPIVFTMDTSINDSAIRFLKTMTKQKWKYRLIGTDDNWVSFLARAYRYLQEIKIIADITPGRICVIADCRDVLCVRTPLSFNKAFEEFNSGIVVSAEYLCGGDPNPKDDSHNVNCVSLHEYWNANGYSDDNTHTQENIPHRQFVNAGLIAGRAKELVHMYEWIVKTGLREEISDDQVLMGKYINTHPHLVKLDSDIVLLHSSTFGASCGYMVDIQEFDSPTISQILGRSSFFIHLPGAGLGKGNEIVYDMVSILIDAGYTNESILNKYKTTEFPWKKFEYKIL